MSEHEKKQASPTPEDSPILMTGWVYSTIATAVVQVWDPYGEVWRGLWRRTSGTPRKAWLEDKETKTKDITRWEKLLNIVPAEEVESGQRIGQEGTTGTVTGDYPNLRTSIFGESGLQYPKRASAPSAEPADRAECATHNWVPQGDKAICTGCGAVGWQP